MLTSRVQINYNTAALAITNQNDYSSGLKVYWLYYIISMSLIVLPQKTNASTAIYCSYYIHYVQKSMKKDIDIHKKVSIYLAKCDNIVIACTNFYN